MELMESAPAPRADAELCAEKDLLLREYDAAASDFSRAVQVLRTRLGVLSKGEYEKLREFSEQSRLRSEKARLALEAHIADHGC
jgi:hypothetical protein